MANPQPHNAARRKPRLPRGCGERTGRPGLYYVRYRDREGNTRYRYTRDLDELARLALELNGEAARANPPIVVDRRLTVGTMLDRWLVDCTNRLRPKSVTGYREHVKAYIRPAVGGVRLAELGRTDVDDMIAGLRARERPLKDSTILGAFNALHVALNWAVDAQLLDRNPIARMKRPGVNDVAIRPPSAREVEDLLAVAAGWDNGPDAAKGHRLEAAFVVAARTGLRQGEVLGLRWSDIDWDAHVIQVSATLDRDTRRRGPTKTLAAAAAVPMIPQVEAALRKHRARQLEERIAARRWREPEMVFTNTRGRALDGRAVTGELHVIQDTAGLRRWRFHDSRHQVATAMLGAGAEVYDVMRALRHTRISTTVDQYGHPTAQQTARIRQLLTTIAESS